MRVVADAKEMKYHLLGLQEMIAVRPHDSRRKTQRVPEATPVGRDRAAEREANLGCDDLEGRRVLQKGAVRVDARLPGQVPLPESTLGIARPPNSIADPHLLGPVVYTVTWCMICLAVPRADGHNTEG